MNDKPGIQSMPYELKELVFVGADSRSLAATCRAFHRISKDVTVVAKCLLKRHGIWTPWTVPPAAVPTQHGQSAPGSQAWTEHAPAGSSARLPSGRLRAVEIDRWHALVADKAFTPATAVSVCHLGLHDAQFVEMMAEYAAAHGHADLMRWLVASLPFDPALDRSRKPSKASAHASTPPDSPTATPTAATAPTPAATATSPELHHGRRGIPQHLKDAALVQSSLYGHLDIVSLLLLAGADPSYDSSSCMSMAAKYGHTDVVAALIAGGARVDDDDNYAVCWASRNGHARIVALLLDHGADPEARQGCPLHWSAENGRAEVVRVLLDWRGPPSSTGTADATARRVDIHSNHDYAIRWCCIRGFNDVLKLLIAAGADVHANDDFAVRNAVKFKHPAVVRTLLDAGADIRACNDEAIKWAMTQGDSKMVDLIVRHIGASGIDEVLAGSTDRPPRPPLQTPDTSSSTHG
ncbi:ankyrin repeat-containing domain protein [Entophlyctis helioformis]|nr:ankyrin repeat-containing domain protein [Entophlyctis helioformis]